MSYRRAPSRPRHVLLLVFVAVMCCLPLASPGHAASLSPAAYKQRVNYLAGRFADAGASFKNSVSSESTPQDAAHQLDIFRVRTLRIAHKILVLGAPRFIYRANRELGRSLAQISRICLPPIKAGERGDRPLFRARLLRLQRQLNGAVGDRARRAAERVDEILAARDY